MKKRKIILTGLTVAATLFIATGYYLVNSSPYLSAEGTMGNGSVDKEGGAVYDIATLYPQEPLSINGIAQLTTDQKYFYNQELGSLKAVIVKDGQMVKKGDILFTYAQDNAEYEVEDAQRELQRMYDKRLSLVQELSDSTGKSHNYQGDELAGYWGEDGNYYRYVVKEIGKSGKGGKGGNTVMSETTPVEQQEGSQMQEGAEGAGGGDLKSQIRELNQNIEDAEIKLIRLKKNDKNNVVAKADGRVVLNMEGADNKNIPLIRVVSDDVSVTGSVTEYDYHLLGENVPVELYVNAERRDVLGTMISHDTVPLSQNSGEEGGYDFNPRGGGGSKYGFIIQPDENIQPGFSVKVNIHLPGVVVPSRAVIMDETGQEIVFLYRDGQAHKVPVNLVKQGAGKVSLDQLQPGDEVILDPYGVVDGQMITTTFDMMGQQGMEGMPPEMMEMDGMEEIPEEDFVGGKG